MPSDPSVSVREVDRVTPALVAAFERLIPQLSSSAPPPSFAELAEIVGSDSNHLLIAGDGDEILGAMTLVVFRIPTGIRAWIEDVVVDQDARGRGVGEALNRHAIDLAYALGASTVDLTSRPSRDVANRLYQRLGFELRATNVYRHLRPPGS